MPQMAPLVLSRSKGGAIRGAINQKWCDTQHCALSLTLLPAGCTLTSMTNLAAILETRLPIEQLRLLRDTGAASADMGAGLYLVGGTVRDMLAGRPTVDLDLAAAGGPDNLPDLLAGRLAGEVVARSQFGTAKLRAGGIELDLAAARTETYAYPGALPTVAPGGIDRDLARRDFSINAMAISLGAETWGELLDPFEGRRDLDLGVVRVLHEGSFTDDATRILRAVRYVGRMGFRLEAETERLLKRDLARLDGIGGDRVRRELARVFAEERAVAILGSAQALGVLPAVHPSFEFDAGAVRTRLAALNERLPLTGPWLLAVLVFKSGKPGRDDIAKRLNLDSNWAGVVRDVGSLREALPRLGRATVRRSEVRALLHHLEPASIVGCAVAVEDALARERLELYLTELRQTRPLLDGDDVMALGVTEGPRVGQILSALLDARLDGLVSTREDEESLVRARVEGPA